MISVTHLRLLVVALVPALALDLTRQLSLDRSTGVAINGFLILNTLTFRNLSALFPAGMPPVERLQPNHCNPLATSSNPLSKALSTSSMADLREGLPRTEL